MQAVISPFRSVVGVMLLILTIGAITCCFLLGKYLIGSYWWLWCVGVFLGVSLSLPLRGMWRWLTGKSNIALTIILNCIVITPVSVSSAMILNYSYPSSEQKARASVTRLYTQTRHQTKRVSRKHYTQGPAYKVYFMEFDIPEIGTKDVECSHTDYKRLMKGDTVTLTVGTGLLGLRYIDPKSIEYPSYITPERKKESLRERRHRKYKEHIDKIRSKHGREEYSDGKPQKED